jgi:hypothetical protein
MTMSNRARVALFVALVALLAGVGVYLATRARAASDVLAAVPRDTFAVATLDLARLRQSPVAHDLESELGALPTLGALKEACGFDPLLRARELAVALPQEALKDFGIVATGEFTRDALVACAAKAIRLRGGEDERSSRGSFTVVEDRASAAPHGAGAAKLAIKDGMVLVASGVWLDEMIDAADGKSPSLADNAQHMELRRALTAKLSKGAVPTLVFSAILPAETRERLKREMLGEAEAAKKNAVMDAVLSVETAGLSLAVGAEMETALELRCATEEACEAVKKLLLTYRKNLLGDFRIALIGLRPVLESVKVEVAGTMLSAGARGETKAIVAGVTTALRSRSDKPAPALQSPARVKPDETLGRESAGAPDAAPAPTH